MSAYLHGITMSETNFSRLPNTQAVVFCYSSIKETKKIACKNRVVALPAEDVEAASDLDNEQGLEEIGRASEAGFL